MVSIRTIIQTSISLTWSLTSSSPSKTRVLGSRVSRRIGILRLTKRVFVDTSVLLHCYYAFVLIIFGYCTSVRGSAADCALQLPEHQVHSVHRLFSDSSFLSSSHRRYFDWILSKSNHCLFSELPSASTRVRHTRAPVATLCFYQSSTYSSSCSYSLLLPEFDILEHL